MSKERILWKPLRAAVAAAPTSPPAGPESTVRTGSRAADSRAVMPPLDCMTKIRGCVCIRVARAAEKEVARCRNFSM